MVIYSPYSRTPNIDCYWVGAVRNVNPLGVSSFVLRGHIPPKPWTFNKCAEPSHADPNPLMYCPGEFDTSPLVDVGTTSGRQSHCVPNTKIDQSGLKFETMQVGTKTSPVISFFCSCLLFPQLFSGVFSTITFTSSVSQAPQRDSRSFLESVWGFASPGSTPTHTLMKAYALRKSHD